MTATGVLAGVVVSEIIQRISNSYQSEQLDEEINRLKEKDNEELTRGDVENILELAAASNENTDLQNVVNRITQLIKEDDELSEEDRKQSVNTLYHIAPSET